MWPTVTDVACSVVFVCVCLSVGPSGELCKMAELIEMLFGVADSCLSPRYRILHGDSGTQPHGKGHILWERAGLPARCNVPTHGCLLHYCSAAAANCLLIAHGQSMWAERFDLPLRRSSPFCCIPLHAPLLAPAIFQRPLTAPLCSALTNVIAAPL